MNYYEIAPLSVVRSNSNFFTYSYDKKLPLGQVVRIEVGKKVHSGVIFKTVPKPEYKTKSIESIIEAKPIPTRLLKLALWISEYYATHLAICLQTMLPAGLHKKRRELKFHSPYPDRIRTNFLLNDDQSLAIKNILKTKNGTFLLRGVTGSGKTRVYIEIAKNTFSSGKSAIILVPEIALTPQLVAEFRHDFEDEQLLITHSKMTEAERYSVWSKCLASDQPLIVIGPRSALFMPLSDLGLIVIDEEHEPSYNQDKAPRYSTVRAATVLSSYTPTKLILGSATPSIVDYYLAQANKRPILTLDKPAIRSSIAASIDIVSLTNVSEFTKHRFFSKTLIVKMTDAISGNKQILLFHNRRGTAPVTICGKCGWQATCPKCYLPTILHADIYRLLCHLCGYYQSVPSVCPQCKNPDIIHKGIGTKLIAEEAAKLFPRVRLARFDADNNLQESLQNNYQALYDGDVQIIIGTQIIAKGLDLPKLSVVGVMQADGGLNLPDYQAQERVFQLLYQVAGRVGRQAEAATSVVVQTYQPNHPVIHLGLQKNYEAFYEHSIDLRKTSHFPPFTHLLKLFCIYSSESAAINSARKLSLLLKTNYPQVQILGPTPAFYERAGGKYKWQLVLKSHRRSILAKISSDLPSNWHANLDPHSLI